MVQPPLGQQPSPSLHGWGGLEEGQGEGEEESGAVIALNGNGSLQRGVDPSICIFWCAVALGALVKGAPFESVRKRELPTLSVDLSPRLVLRTGRVLMTRILSMARFCSPRTACPRLQ